MVAICQHSRRPPEQVPRLRHQPYPQGRGLGTHPRNPASRKSGHPNDFRLHTLRIPCPAPTVLGTVLDTHVWVAGYETLRAPGLNAILRLHAVPDTGSTNTETIRINDLRDTATTTDCGTVTAFADYLLDWYRDSGRHTLPWKIRSTPYRVWLSEVMLQQTQVSTVLEYFPRFIEQFPDLETLAAADEDAVLAAWTGLGYYRRARNLWKAARQVMAEYEGELPQDVKALQTLPGIGRSTAGAIMALAFNERAPILDGNVKRVLTRLHGIADWPGKSDVEKQLWALAEAHTPKRDVSSYTQAIMDLGATLCTRREPACARCPARALCTAYRLGLTEQLPVRSPRTKTPERSTRMLVIEDENGRFLLEKRPERGVWGGLWCFPEHDDNPDPAAAVLELAGQEAKLMPTPTRMRHQFTHYRLNLTLSHVRTSGRTPLVVRERQVDWFAPDELSTVGLAAPVVRLLKPPMQD